jgi:hypothetical protein
MRGPRVVWIVVAFLLTALAGGAVGWWVRGGDDKAPPTFRRLRLFSGGGLEDRVEARIDADLYAVNEDMRFGIAYGESASSDALRQGPVLVTYTPSVGLPRTFPFMLDVLTGEDGYFCIDVFVHHGDTDTTHAQVLAYSLRGGKPAVDVLMHDLTAGER